jgi:hypothetical protein
MRLKNARRRTANDARIMSIWDDVTDEFDDKSTEFCIQMTADRAIVDYGRVVDALSRQATQKETTNA